VEVKRLLGEIRLRISRIHIPTGNRDEEDTVDKGLRNVRLSDIRVLDGFA